MSNTKRTKHNIKVVSSVATAANIESIINQIDDFWSDMQGCVKEARKLKKAIPREIDREYPKLARSIDNIIEAEATIREQINTMEEDHIFTSSTDATRES